MAARPTAIAIAAVGVAAVLSYFVLPVPYNSVAFGTGAGLLAVSAVVMRKRLKGLVGEKGVLPGVPSGTDKRNLGRTSRERDKQQLLRRFDLAFNHLTTSDPAGRAQALEALRPILFDMSPDIEAWTGDTRLRMHYLVKEIAKDIDNASTQRQSIGILVLVLSKGGATAVEVARPILFDKVKGLYGNPLFKNERLLPRLLLILEQYDQSMAKSLVKDAIHSWDEEQFNAAKSYLGFEELDDPALHNQIRGLLNSELDRADIDSDEKAKNRAVELLHQQVTVPKVAVSRKRMEKRAAQYAASALAVSLVIIVAFFAGMPTAPALSSHTGQGGPQTFGQGGSGILSVFLTDGPSPDANMRYLLVNVSSVDMGVQGMSGLEPSSYILAVPHDVGMNVNLSSLQGQSLALGGVQMPSGNVTSTSLDLSGATAYYTDGSSQQLQVVGNGNLMVPIQFGVAPSGLTNLTIDVTPSLNQIQENATLTPVIHATALEEIPNGTSTQTVTVTQTATAPAVTTTATQSVTFLSTVTATLASSVVPAQTVTSTLTAPTTTIIQNSTFTSTLISPTTLTATVTSTSTTGITLEQTTQTTVTYTTTTTYPTSTSTSTTTQTVTSPTTTTETVTSTVGSATSTVTKTSTGQPTTTTTTVTSTATGSPSTTTTTVTSPTTTTKTETTTTTTTVPVTTTSTVTGTSTATTTSTATSTHTETSTSTVTVTTTETTTTTTTYTRTRGEGTPVQAISQPPWAGAAFNSAAGLAPLLAMGALLTMAAVSLLALPRVRLGETRRDFGMPSSA